MKKIYLTGSSGFVGTNFLKYFERKFQFVLYRRSDKVEIPKNTFAVIHLAGLAHDLKKTSKEEDYFKVNTVLTKKVFDSFLLSDAEIFIYVSSVKAIADSLDEKLTEKTTPNPKTYYGKSKLLAEQYISSKKCINEKKIYILRPCIIHGPGNKGNLNLLYKFISRKIPWPLGNFNNSRSFLYIGNLLHVFGEILGENAIPAGTYNVADTQPLSTNDLVHLIFSFLNIKPKIISIDKKIIHFITKICSFLKLPFNKENLDKLTSSYVVDNSKLLKNLSKPLPFSTKEGLLITLNALKNENS